MLCHADNVSDLHRFLWLELFFQIPCFVAGVRRLPVLAKLSHRLTDFVLSRSMVFIKVGSCARSTLDAEILANAEWP